MKDNWHNKEFAQDWDRGESRTHPVRAEHLGIITSILKDNYKDDGSILDIGCGSGQVEELIFQKIPKAKIIGVDSSEEMLQIAKDRLKNFSENLTLIQKKIPELEIEDVPSGIFNFALCVQVLHELTTSERSELFKKVYSKLENGGMFLISDRVKIEINSFKKIYKSIWGRLESSSSWKSNKSFEQYYDKINNKEDSPGSIKELTGLLNETGFQSAILHVNFDRALLVGVKGGSNIFH